MLQATLQLFVLDQAACVLHTLENRHVVLSPETMIHSLKFYLLAGSPEVRDQDLAGIVVPGSEREREERERERASAISCQHNIATT